MSLTAIHAKDGGLLISGFDLQDTLTQSTIDFRRDTAETSVFGTGDKEYIPGMRDSVHSCQGLRKGDKSSYEARMRLAIGDADADGIVRQRHILTSAPDGYGIGKVAYLGRVIQSQWSVAAPISGAVTISASFQTSGGSRPGVFLHSHKLASGAGAQNEIQNISIGSGYTSGAITINVTRPDGTTGSFSVTPGDSTTTIGANASTAYGSAGSVTASGTSSAPSVGASLTTGGTAFASDDNNGSNPASNVFDGSQTTDWATFNPAPAHVGYDLGAGNAQVAKSYRITVPSGGGRDEPSGAFRFTSWVFEASNDNSTWTALDTRTSGYGTNASPNLLPLSNTTAYRYYRLRIISTANGSVPQIRELGIYGAGPAAALNVNLTFSGTLAGQNIAPMTTPTPGVSISEVLTGGPTTLNYVGTTGNGAVVDLGVNPNPNHGLIAQLHAIEATGTSKSLGIKIQHADSATGPWSDLATFPTLSDARTLGGSIVTLPDGAGVKQFVREVIVSISGQWAYSVALSRRNDGGA